MKIYVITESYAYEYSDRFVSLVFSEEDAVSICNNKEKEHNCSHYCCGYEVYETP